MPIIKVNSFRGFTDRIREVFTEDQEKSVVFIDIDGILTLLREFYVENELTKVIKRFMTKSFTDVLNARHSDVSELMKLISLNCPKSIVEDLTKRINKEVSAQNQKRELASTPELNEKEIADITLDIVCKQFAFGLGMETSPVCELTLPILPGKPSEKATLAKDLLSLLHDKKNMHVFFLTSRPLGAAKNIVYILSELSRAAGLEEDELFKSIRQRNGDLKLDTKKSDFEHEIHVIADGVCIASGRNRKDQVISAFFKQFGVLHQTAFIDDKESYATEVIGLEETATMLVVAQQEIPSPAEIAPLITTNPRMHSQVGFSMRNAIAGYPLHKLPGHPDLTSAANQALCGLMMLGVMLSPSDEPVASQAAMAFGKRALENMLTSLIPKPIGLNSHLFLSAPSEVVNAPAPAKSKEEETQAPALQ